EAVRSVRARAGSDGGPGGRVAPAQVGASPGHGGARHSKESRGVLCQAVRVKYAFMRDHEREFRVRTMCRVLDVHPSGYYAWRRAPLSARAKDDRRVLGLIKQSWLESGSVYGYRKVARDLDRKSTRLNSSHVKISYAVFCLKKKSPGNKTER